MFAATRLRWRRRRQPITRPGPPPARHSPSPVMEFVCRLTAPGAGGVVCCGPPPGVPRAAPSARSLQASAPALPPVLNILDGNSSCVVVWFPDGPAADPAAEFAVCGRPPWPMVSASAGFCDALRLRPGSVFCRVPRSVFAFHHFLFLVQFRSSSVILISHFVIPPPHPHTFYLISLSGPVL
jgi:hypothetical protein